MSAAVFLGSVWLQFGRASEWLAVIRVAGGLLYVMLALRLAGDYVVLASLEAVDDAVTARGVFAAGVVTTEQLPVAPLVMVIATLLARLRYGVFPRSLLWFNVVMLALLVVAFLSVGPAGLMGLLGIVWFLVASLVFAAGPVEELRSATAR